jgi:uncharacterized protein with PQ loop repeat
MGYREEKTRELMERFGPDDEEKSSGFLHMVLDTMIYLVGVIGPALAVSQMYDVWVSGYGDGVSLSWAVFTLFSPFWILYGYVNKKKPIIVAFSLWFAAGLLMLFGSFLFE